MGRSTDWVGWNLVLLGACAKPQIRPFCHTRHTRHTRHARHARQACQACQACQASVRRKNQQAKCKKPCRSRAWSCGRLQAQRLLRRFDSAKPLSAASTKA